jgi:NAD(P)-dependent dehydrogenase (short-subunit alcohol dehydrogenase family)
MGTELFDLTGKVAVVTGSGANGGIGHAIALGFAMHGADVAVSDIDDEGAATTAHQIEELGRKTFPSHCDISKLDDVTRLFGEVDKHFGRVDVLVNVPFAFPVRVHPHELSPEDWDLTFAVSAKGYFLCAQEAIRRMLLQEPGGSIINIGSIAGVSALGRGNFPYSCAKGAVSQMTKELAVEYAGRKIRVNGILPASVLTPGVRKLLDDPRFTAQILPTLLKGLPLGRLLTPADLVGPAEFLASDAAAAITGVLFPVDGGNLALNASGSHTWPESNS